MQIKQHSMIRAYILNIIECFFHFKAHTFIYLFIQHAQSILWTNAKVHYYGMVLVLKNS